MREEKLLNPFKGTAFENKKCMEKNDANHYIKN